MKENLVNTGGCIQNNCLDVFCIAVHCIIGERTRAIMALLFIYINSLFLKKSGKRHLPSSCWGLSYRIQLPQVFS